MIMVVAGVPGKSLTHMKALPCLTAESAGWGGMSYGVSFLGSSPWKQPGGEARRGLSPVTLGSGSQLRRAESVLPSPQLASGTEQQQRSESRTHESEKAVKPWVWTVGRHILTRSLLSAPGRILPIPGHREKTSRSGSSARHQVPREKAAAEIRSAPVPASFHLHMAKGTRPRVGWPGARTQHPNSGCCTLDKVLLPTAKTWLIISVSETGREG